MLEALHVEDPGGVTASMRYTRPPVFVLLPAMGVAASFYAPFVRELEQTCGATVLALDLPGQGASRLRARAGDDFGYREAVEELVPDALRRARREQQQRPLFLIGHSLGGQLATLACAEVGSLLDGLVLIAAGTAHWRTWPRGHRWLAAVTVHAIAATAMLLPWYPGEFLVFGGNQARRLMRDWSFNARTGRYRLEGSARSPHDLVAALRGVSLPVLAISISGDPVAPPGARDELLSYLPAAVITRETVPGVAADARWRRHFSWARRPSGVAASVAMWLRSSAVP
jgi:predicted alpha/beta hydrolase